MNGKKAKQLRQMARSIVGDTPTTYGIKNKTIKMGECLRKATKGLKKVFRNLARTKGYEHTTEGLQALRQQLEQGN
jgi:hypothetical protein